MAAQHSDPPVAFADSAHDHARCVRDAVARAERICQREDLKLTAVRRRVLELVWQNHRPAKAYDLLDQLRADNARAAPPTVYRALEFLKKAGLVHHLESIDAFVGCGLDPCEGRPQFLICRSCRRVAEMHSRRLHADAARAALDAGFCTETEVIELHGLCQRCVSATGEAPSQRHSETRYGQSQTPGPTRRSSASTACKSSPTTAE